MSVFSFSLLCISMLLWKFWINYLSWVATLLYTGHLYLQVLFDYWHRLVIQGISTNFDFSWVICGRVKLGAPKTWLIKWRRCVQLRSGGRHRYFVRSWSPMIFHWLFCIQYHNITKTYNIILSTCGAFSEVVFESDWGATYSGSARAKLILAPLGMPKWVDTQRTVIECSSFKPPHYLLIMHQ